MPSNDLVSWSSEFLRALRNEEDSDPYRQELADLSDSRLAGTTEDPGAAKALWINLYNALVQADLATDPERYHHRRSFFGESRHTVAGHELSLDDIEHGLLRSSKWKYGLGYLPRPFPNELERRHRLPAVDPRIHFALNCGAASCPPIAAYSRTDIEDQLDRSTESFLAASVERDYDARTLRVSRIFLWYRGDFGGRAGIYEFLERFDVIAKGERPTIRYRSYDWSLSPAQFR